MWARVLRAVETRPVAPPLGPEALLVPCLARVRSPRLPLRGRRLRRYGRCLLFLRVLKGPRIDGRRPYRL